jgi:hypothetical protein
MIEVSSFSEAGGHPANEDSFLVLPHPLDSAIWLCALADGQGGRAGGARAAQLACRTALDLASTLPPENLDEAAWVRILESADAAVERDPEAGFTTLIALAVRGSSVAGGSSGDSMAFAFSQGGRPLELTRAQRKNPPVGSGAAAPVGFACQLRPPWRVGLASDGVWKYAGLDRLTDGLARVPGPQLIEDLQGAARLPGSGAFQDDFTILILEGAE